MRCDEVSEFLPWFVNGTLSTEDTDEIERHLTECADCRRELSETGAAFEVFDAHLSAESLLEIAYGGATGSRVAEQHLAECEICAERLALVRESQGALARAEAEEESSSPPELPLPRNHLSTGGAPAAVLTAQSTPWRSLALAASVAAMVTTTGWIWTSQSGQPSSFRGAESPAGDAGTPSASEPLLNVTVVTISPDRLVRLGDDSGSARVPVESSGVTLLLDSELVSDAPVTCRLASRDGSVVWSREGLERRPEGGYALSVPTAALRAGGYVLTLLDGEGHELESYSIELR